MVVEETDDLDSRFHRELRIEALRVASGIVAGISARSDAEPSFRLDKATINLAEQFARWLESGEK